ncbi:hypothetical protein OSB04_002363 [Centaurea solstitialis]|uniref:Uncharacterized protein n=1 Tax=Centaurea solstitialis TaxID=347529 RepID=A0AA38UAL5_9ASTR|nr:hypothetical protein OSB04_002363 [Centaurea solstitialis]
MHNINPVAIWRSRSSRSGAAKFDKDEDQEPIEEVQTQDLRRSTRVRQEPDRYLGFLVSQDGGDLNEPTSYGEAVSGSESEQWQEAMKAEMQSMYDNQVWELTDLPQHYRAVGRKWFSRRKLTWTEMCTLLRLDWSQKDSRKLMVSTMMKPFRQ